MTDQWQELKETITEMRDNDGTGTQQEVCKFLVNYMEVLEKQMQEPCEDVPDINDGNIYECSCGYGWDKSKVVRHHFCPNCGRAVEPSYNSIKTELKPCGDAVIETIEELPPAMSQWIPVSERLPEEYKTVMASTDYFAVFPEARYTKDGWEWAYESGSDYWEELANVIAWMPLPAPYKTESEE